jgi:hypothetical protein
MCKLHRESEGTEREGKKKETKTQKYDFMDGEYTITGYPNREKTIKEFDSAYDFEDYIRRKVNCKGISFDSESCQFFAYAKSKARALSFLKAIEKQFQKIREVLD